MNHHRRRLHRDLAGPYRVALRYSRYAWRHRHAASRLVIELKDQQLGPHHSLHLDPIGVEHLSFARPEPAEASAPPAGSGAYPWVPEIPGGGLSLEILERELIIKALEMARGNKSQAARLLGLTRRTLYSRMERHGLRKAGEGEEPGEDEEGGPAEDATASPMERSQ